MAKVKLAAVESLVVALGDPGMTPMLRAGLGGLAASLRVVAHEKDPNAEWPSPIRLGPGTAMVEKRHIRIDFGGSPADTLKALFAATLRVRTVLNVIELVGMFEASRPPDVPVLVTLQNALKRTFLQHGKSTTKAGAAHPSTVDLGEQRAIVQVQPYSAFAHQSAWESVLEAIERGSVELAGWAYPGAAQRHIAFGETRCCGSTVFVLPRIVDVFAEAA